MNTPKEHTRVSVFNAMTSRNFAGILMAFITSTIMIPGMTIYFPLSGADQIAVPILLFPFIWTALCLYSYLATKVWHAWALMGVLALFHAALSYVALTS